MDKLKIEYWAVEKLQEYEGNARKHSKADVKRLGLAIQEYGFRVPVLAGSDGVLVDGHLRLMAARQVGLEQIPVVCADGMSAAQVRAFRILVNRAVEWATWDADMLARELEALEGMEFDLELTGLDMEDVDAYLRALDDSRCEKDPDAVPDPPAVPVSALGDVWTLGPHRVICGDSCSASVLHCLTGGQPVQMVWTDPPYNVDYEGKAGKIKNDKMLDAAFVRFLQDAFKAMFTVLEDGGAIYVAHAEVGGGLSFRRAFARAGFKFSACLVWRKNQFVLGRSDYQFQHEPILYGWKPTAPHTWYGGRKQRSVIEMRDGTRLERLAENELQLMTEDGVFVITGEGLQVQEVAGTVVCVDKPQRSELHPTMKPVELVERFVRNSSPRGGLVLDSFGGSGSTLMACEVSGRKARLVELDPRFVDVIVRRWEEYTGQDAVLESTGRTFAEVTAERRVAA